MSASAASPVAKTTAINIHIPKVTFVTTRWGVVTNPADKANAVRDYIKKANDCYSKLKTAGEDGKYLRYVKLKASLEGVAKLLIDTPSCATEGQKIQKLIEHTSKKIKSMNVVNLQK